MQAGEVATKGVLSDACAAGYRECSGMADGGARVPEVLSAFLRDGWSLLNHGVTDTKRLNLAPMS